MLYSRSLHQISDSDMCRSGGKTYSFNLYDYSEQCNLNIQDNNHDQKQKSAVAPFGKTQILSLNNKI